MRHTVTVFCVLISLATSAKLPASFKKCNLKAANSKQCLSVAAADAIGQLDKPIKELGLPSINPLEIPSLVIPAGSQAVGLEQRFKDVKIYGFINPKETKFEIDLDKNTAHLEVFYEELRADATYDIKGKILLLPVYGNGPAVVTFEKVKGMVDFVLEQYEKKGKKYIKIVSSKLSLEPQRVRFKFDNLFNGDKALGDNINNVINDNWKEIFEDVKSNYEEAFNQIIVGLMNNLMARVPLSELFINE